MALVSVIIPTYKAVDCLRLCAQSLARSEQKEHFEVCIYGDGGGDAARDCIESCKEILSAANISCVAFYNPQNLGNTPAVNRAVGLSRGQWLFLCNDDMVFPRDWLSVLKPLLIPNRIISVACVEPPVGGHRPSKYFYAQNLGLDPQQFNMDALDDFNRSIRETVNDLQPGVHYPFFVERSVFEHVGAADERFRGPYHDPDLFLRFRLHGAEMVRTRRCALYHFSGVSLRFADSEMSANQKRKKTIGWVQQENEARLQFIQKWGAKPRSRFGDIPATRCSAPFDWNTAGVLQKAGLRLLLMWERARAWVREKRHS